MLNCRPRPYCQLDCEGFCTLARGLDRLTNRVARVRLVLSLVRMLSPLDEGSMLSKPKGAEGWRTARISW